MIEAYIEHISFGDCLCFTRSLFIYFFSSPENILLGDFDILKSTEV